MDKGLQEHVRTRAAGRCEYCRFPEALSELPHVIDHIVSRQHHGATSLENLALCCGRCNRFKGPNIAGIDPANGALTRLFNPRTDHWAEHFAWAGATLTGLTAVGRATVEVLKTNHPQRVLVRLTLIRAGKLVLP